MPNLLATEEDWYVPHPSAMPRTTDQPAIPPAYRGAMSLEAPAPEIPPGSAYSASRKRWRTPQGTEFEAHDFAPLPADRNVFDAGETRNWLGAGSPKLEFISGSSSQQPMQPQRPVQPMEPQQPTTRLRDI